MQVSEEDAFLLFSNLGLSSLHDCRWFRKSDIRGRVMQKMIEDLAIIEPYYLPHKKFMCYRDMTPQRMISILRHIAKSRNMWLETQEKGRYGKKEVYYRLRSADIPTEISWSVTFD
jgi:hypothetical protein